jgi:hypothetical protein
MGLSGKELDAAVARLEGLDVVYRNGQPAFEHEWDPELHCHEDDLDGEFKAWVHYKPSSCWSDGGPLIEREKLTIGPMNMPAAQGWFAHKHSEDGNGGIGKLLCRAYGPTPLIAAMRCYVEFKGL